MIGILIQKILSLALIMALGFLLVRCKVVKAESSKVLSTLSLNLIMPCMILTAFQVDYTPEVRDGLLLAFAAAIGIHVLLLILNILLKRFLHLDAVEQVSVMYSNAGNLIIPLITSILGKDWVIYTSAFIVVQQILLWSHGKFTLCEERGFNPKKVFLNVSMISIFIGLILFVTQIRLPALLQETADSVGGMIGPVSMLVTGMLIGGMDLKKILGYRRVWLVAALRLLLVPLLVIPLLKFTGIAQLVPDGGQVLLVTFLATTTPAASSITQFAQVYDRDAKYASAINVITTLLCIVTIPAMVYLYQL